MLVDFAHEEIKQPTPRKKIDVTRTIYQSRHFRRPFGGKGFGLPILRNFGEARVGKTHESGPFVQPNIYRAPEIIFEMAWGSAVDIWNLGALVSGAWGVSPAVHFTDKSQIWDLFEGQHLFGAIFDQNGNHDPFKHLALMVALIGPPPADFVQRSETTSQCFDYNGKRHQVGIQFFNRISVLVLTFLQVIGLLMKMRSCLRPPWRFWRKGFAVVKRNLFFIFLGRC